MEKAKNKALEGKEIESLRSVLSILSKKEALIVLSSVAQSLKSDLSTPEKLGMAKKPYYTRLKVLVDLGLVQKEQGVYILTSLGEKVYEQQVLGLAANLRNSKKFQMIDALKKDRRFSDKEIGAILKIE
ncbi:MAG: hypothetical protein KGH54_00935 [Candidatus Micrarchaeota archaeon]|nr:hypothetical protein [Candidatus Micrarchaeota archaeon]